MQKGAGLLHMQWLKRVIELGLLSYLKVCYVIIHVLLMTCLFRVSIGKVFCDDFPFIVCSIGFNVSKGM